jgi:hypothetical protein
MKKMPLIAGFLALLAALNSATAEDECDRQCLVTLMDQYLVALANHNPSAVPLDAAVKFVENTRKTEIGKGLWETIY